MNEHISFEELSSYLDDELAPDRRATVEAHLAACDACRQEYDLLTWIEVVALELPRTPMPEGLSFDVTPEREREYLERRREREQAHGQPEQADRQPDRGESTRLSWLAVDAAVAAVLLLSMLSLVCDRGLFGAGCQTSTMTALRLWDRRPAQPTAQLAGALDTATPALEATPVPSATVAVLVAQPTEETPLEIGGAGNPEQLATIAAAMRTVTTPTVTRSPTAPATTSPTATPPALAAAGDRAPASSTAAAPPPPSALLLMLVCAGVLAYGLRMTWQGRSPGRRNRSRFRALI